MLKKMTNYRLSIVALLSLMLLSCNNSDKAPDVSKVDVDLSLVPFYSELDGIDTMQLESSVQTLVSNYPSFMEAFSHRIMKVGAPDSEGYAQRVLDFVNYDANKDIIDTAKLVFPDFDQFKIDLTQGFKYYKYYYPQQTTPDVFLMVSGFSQSIAVDSAWIGISIEKYLGSDCVFYDWLEIPKYMRVGMIKEKMAPDVLRALALTMYPERNKNEDVVSSMIYEGKIKYFVKKMFPDLADTLLFDYSAQQLQWAEKMEANTWSTIVEWKHLFNDERVTIQKYTGDGPFSSFFGNNSAPRIGEYLGYNIVRAYMKNNPDVSLEELMLNNDGRKILAASQYRP